MVNPDEPDHGRTALSHAAESGVGGGENSPQAGKVNPDEPDDHGGTPLPYRTVLRMDVREW